MDGAVRPFGRIDPRRETPSQIAVVVSKVLHSACLFWAYGVLQHLPLAVFLLVTKGTSSVIYVLLQRPMSSGKRISRVMWMKILRYSALVAMSSILWTLGLTLCGALRTILLWEHSELALLAAVTAITTLNHDKGRGAVFLILGVCSMLLFDNDQTNPPSDHPEGPHRSVVAHSLYQSLSFLGVPDHKGGIVLLLMGVCLTVVQKSVGRKLSVELGGAKRLQALSTLVVAVMILPWALWQLSTQVVSISWSSTLFCLLTTSVVQVVDFYSSSIAIQKLDAHRIALISSVVAFLSALLSAVVLWYFGVPMAHKLSAGVVIGAVFFIMATPTLTRPPPRSSQNTLIGYSVTGLPLYQSHRSGPSLMDYVRPSLQKIMENPDSRRIFYFLLLNLGFTFVELTYGVWTNSLGLISDGFHMLFDCTALLVGLHASLMSRWKPTRLYSYGYGKVEVLSGFVNGLFLVVIACFVLGEVMERLLDPPDINTEKLLFVSVAGFIVNLIGIITFSRNHTHSHSHGGHGHSHSHSNSNMRGVFLHVLADTMGSVGVIISTLLIEQFGWFIADPICSLFIAILILISVIPLLRDSAEILLLTTPRHGAVQATLDKLPRLDGVMSCTDAHFWQHSSDSIAGTLHIQVAPSANEQKVITSVTNFLRENGITYLTIQVEKEHYLHCNITQSYINQLAHSTPPQIYVDYGPHTGQIKAV